MNSALLASAIAQIGKLHDGPDVVRLAQEIAAKRPEEAAYWRDAGPGTPWCGIFQAWNLVVNHGYALPKSPNGKGVGAMYVDWWLDVGEKIPVDQAQPGDLAIWLGNPHHISMVGGDGKYVGGNQSDGVTRATYRTPDAVRRVSVAPVVAQPADDHPEIKLGAMGPAVTKLQALLGIEQDGEFGPDTDAAVRALQASRGLDPDGEVGPLTWSALESGAPAVVSSSKGSWYSQYDGKYRWRDGEDKPNSAALGVPDDAQGIARPQKFGTLGTWFMVRAPNGKVSIEQQTDHGPGVSTGRTIDISAAAAERFGYSPSNFPTDSIFTFWPVDPPAAVAGLSKQQQAVKYRDMRKDQTVTEPTPIPEPARPTPAPTSPVVPGAPSFDIAALFKFIVEHRDEAFTMLRFALGAYNSMHPGKPISLGGVVPSPSAPATNPLQRPSVLLSGGALGITGLLQLFGHVPAPGAESLVGTLATIIPAASAVLGTFGGWGAAAAGVLNVVGRFANAARQPATK